MNLAPGRNREADGENGCVDMVGGAGEGVTKGNVGCIWRLVFT